MTRRNLTRLALIASAGLAVGWLEYLFIPPLGVPGVKLGLANIATLAALYMYGFKAGALVLVSRMLLSGFLFGSPASIIYALSGGVCALCAMELVRRTGWFSAVGASVAGGVCHNMGQLLTAALVAKTPGLAYYLPVLVISGVITGAVTGITARAVLKRAK